MKNHLYLVGQILFLVLSILCLNACSTNSKVVKKSSPTNTDFESSKLAKYEQPALRLNFLTDASGKYRYTPPIDRNLAGQITELDQRVPESVLCYFLASQIRKDLAWQETVPEANQRGTDLRMALKSYEGSTLQSAKLLKKEAPDKVELWITVALSFELKDGLDTSEEEFVLEKKGDNWLLVEVPN